MDTSLDSYKTSALVHNCRGFVQPQLLVAGAIVAGLIILGLGIALKVQTARLDAAEADLSACKTRYSEALGQISRQNEAIEDWQKAEAQARERAAKAQKAANAILGASKAERERLAEAAKQAPKGPCPAGEGLKRVREGLKP